MEMGRPRYAAERDQPFLRKVPEVIALFWVTKVLTTGLGEATSDFLVHAIAPIVAVAIGAAGLAVATFALGTAAGDMTATTLRLGFLLSGVLFAVLIAIPAVAHRWLAMNAILAFWFAYIITRPLGASFADWLGVSHARTGLGWGTGSVSIGAAAVLVGVVGYLAISHRDVADTPTDARRTMRSS